jgi:hypothetical protein
VLVLLGVAAGVGVAALRQPRVGMYVVAAALAVGALVRLFVRPRTAGSLVVRSRHLDVVVLTALAVAVAVLAAVTPLHGTG